MWFIIIGLVAYILIAVLFIALANKAYYTYHEKVPKVIATFAFIILTVLLIALISMYYIGK